MLAKGAKEGGGFFANQASIGQKGARPRLETNIRDGF